MVFAGTSGFAHAGFVGIGVALPTPVPVPLPLPFPFPVPLPFPGAVPLPVPPGTPLVLPCAGGAAGSTGALVAWACVSGGLIASRLAGLGFEATAGSRVGCGVGVGGCVGCWVGVGIGVGLGVGGGEGVGTTIAIGRSIWTFETTSSLGVRSGCLQRTMSGPRKTWSRIEIPNAYSRNERARSRRDGVLDGGTVISPSCLRPCSLDRSWSDPPIWPRPSPE